MVLRFSLRYVIPRLAGLTVLRTAVPNNALLRRTTHCCAKQRTAVPNNALLCCTHALLNCTTSAETELRQVVLYYARLYCTTLCYAVGQRNLRACSSISLCETMLAGKKTAQAFTLRLY